MVDCSGSWEKDPTMAANGNEKGGQAGGAPSEKSTGRILELDAVLRTLGFIYYNTANSCWFSASDKKQTMAEGHSLVAAILDKHDVLRFTVAEGAIKINGEEYASVTNHTKQLAAHLSKFGGCNFTFSRGLERDEFASFMELISRPEEQVLAAGEGDFTEAVNRSGFRHIVSRKIILKEVTDEDVVVSRKELNVLAGAERQKVEADVLSLLKAGGETGPSQEERSASLRSALQDTERLAELVIQAASEKNPAGASVDKKQVAAIVVECLDRAFQTLVEDPFSRTQKGKKAIASALQKLEKELLSKMQAQEGDDASEMVSGAVERMTERLKMDSIVQDYTRKLKALEESEKQILKFMKLQGLERLQQAGLSDRMREEGLDVSDWHRLLAESCKDQELEDEAARAVKQLADLLARVQDEAARASAGGGKAPQTAELAGDLKEINARMDKIALCAQKKLDNLAQELAEDSDIVEAIEKVAVAEGRAVKVPRRRLLAVLMEVIQEFMQPLSVIKCSVQMLNAGMLGDVSQTQREMLALIHDSSERLGILVKNLEKVAGVTPSLNPDKEIVGELNRAGQ